MTEVAERPCPICGRAVDARYKPFCSARCANVDLSRWLNESYRIPTKPDDDEEESASKGEAEEPATSDSPAAGGGRKPS